MRTYLCRAGLAFPLVCLTTGLYAQSSTELYEYDALGRVLTVTDDAARTDYDYDDAGNRTQVDKQLLFTGFWLASNLPHLVGYADQDGWAANVNTGIGHMTYGPYVTNIPAGARTAVWHAMIDVVNGWSDDVVTIDVYDATADEILAVRTLTRNEWHSEMNYQIFELPFQLGSARAGHAIELRTFYHANAFTRVQKIGYY